jgi:glycine/D-amino acid oxidase-like deaminating enzyme
VGAIIAFRLIQRNIPVRIFDSGTKMMRNNAQVPWGWFRRKSLQQKVRLHNEPLDLPVLQSTSNKTFGKMIITTRDNNKVGRWKEWISSTNTDASILTPKEAEQEYDIREDYFLNSGGILVCDSNDFIIDFQELNRNIWDFLENNKLCEMHTNTPIDKISFANGETVIESNGDKINCKKTIVSVGNQTEKLIKIYKNPIIKTTLPWAITTSPDKKKYVALWNQNSSIQMFSDSDNNTQMTKIGCGNNCVLDIRQTKLENLPYFASMGYKGLKNITFVGNENKKNYALEKLIEESVNELKYLGLDVTINDMNACTVDMTPTLCPVVKFIGNNNTMVINGFSGSGFTSNENWFAESVIKTLFSGIIDDKLKTFGDKTFIGHIMPTSKEKTYTLA